MKSQLLIYIGLVVSGSCGVISSHGQSFINLDFESANVSGYSPGSINVPASSALPGWTVTFDQFGTSQTTITSAGYDKQFDGNERVTVDDSNVGSAVAPIQGLFSLALDSSSDNLVESSISQTGRIPTGTLSLLLDAETGGTPFVVKFGNQTINMLPVQTFTDYTLYAGDISSLAGLVEKLTITEPVPPGTFGQIGQGGELVLDNIQFSPQPVPEPGELSLQALGTLFLIPIKRRAHC